MKKLILISLFLVAGCTEYNQFANPSPESVTAQVVGMNDFYLCRFYFETWMGSARSKEFRYRFNKPTVEEVKRRNLDCNSFPELAHKEPWKDEWVREYEESLNQ